MKVYFEDGPLYSKTSLELGCDHIVNASVGYSNNEYTFDRIMAVKSNASIYTNSIVVLTNAQKYCWNNELDTFEIYLKKDKQFIRIDDLTDKQLRFAHNIYYMWLAGVFNSRKVDI